MRGCGTIACVLLLSASGCSSDAWQPSDPTFVSGSPSARSLVPAYTNDTAQTPPPPVSGGTLALLSDQVTAVASDADNDTVWIVDLPSRSVRGAVQLDAGDEPGRIAEGANARVHVVLRRGGGIATIDTSGTGTLVRRTSVCGSPRGVAYDPNSTQLYVACTDGQLAVLQEPTGTIDHVLTGPEDLRDVVVSNGTVFVSQFRAAAVYSVSSSGSFTRLSMGSTPEQIPDVGYRLAPSPGGVTLVHQLALSSDIPIPLRASASGPTTTGYYGYSVVNCTPPVVVGAVTNFGSGIGGTPQQLQAAVLPVDVAVSPRRTVVIAAGNASITGFPQLIDLADGASPCATTAFGGYSYYGTPMMPTTAPRITEQPRAQSIAGVLDAQDRLIVQTRQPGAIYLIDEHAFIRLPAPSRADTGHEIFYTNAGANIACASCHAEGEDDGHVWNFPDVGVRRTQHLAGGLGNGPFHWGGELPHFTDVMTTVFEQRMAGPALTGDQMNAVGRYLHAVPAPPPRTSVDASAAARGQALFQSVSVGCAACHSGPRYTNDALMNVGTGGTFKVPSLIAIAAHPPFMHNGCAATLADRFGPCGGGDAHGHTSQLTDAQRSDLVAYLQTL